MNMRRFLYYVLPLFFWMTMIFGGSTDAGSSRNTRSLLDRVLHWAVPDIEQRLPEETIARILWDIRKTAHVTEYGILTILAYRAVGSGNPRFRSRNIILPLLIAIAYAATDEYHQSFTATREGCARDVFYDTAGAFMGMVACLWHHCLRNQRSLPTPTGTGSAD